MSHLEGETARLATKPRLPHILRSGGTSPLKTALPNRTSGEKTPRILESSGGSWRMHRVNLTRGFGAIGGFPLVRSPIPQNPETSGMELIGTVIFFFFFSENMPTSRNPSLFNHSKYRGKCM